MNLCGMAALALAGMLLQQPGGAGGSVSGVVRDSDGGVLPGAVVALTDAGARKLAEAIEPWRAAQSRFEDAFGRDAALALRAALARVASLELGGR